MAVNDPDLRVPEDDGLSKLAGDLEFMQRHLDDQVRRMDGIVDRIQARWHGATGDAYRTHHVEAAQDAVRIREHLRLLEEAVRFSRDGFSERELEVLSRLRKAQSQVDVAREANALQAPPPGAPAAGSESAPVPRSRIEDV
ncbi:WXG100 family type VII secretion target [Streptomyces sp. NPDC093111]|uniref:WXG100 family type VII secretion target n=1 Tax=Streptomyces sp. NPDC093111 TaxID=3154978 RepID=UPI00344559B4